MKAKYSIGEMSKLFNIPITTLRHYHNKGIFQAGYIDEESGYRYYYAEQFELLNSILSLRNSGMSLERIREITRDNDFTLLKEGLKTQKEEIRRKIEELEERERELEGRISYLEQIEKVEIFDRVFQEDGFEDEVIVLDEGFETEEELELKIRRLGKISGFEHSLTLGNVGLIMKREAPYKKYSGVYIKKGKNSKRKKYLKVCYKGTKDDSYRYYEMMERYIEEKKVEVEDRYYELALMLLPTDNNERQYLRVIKIAKK